MYYVFLNAKLPNGELVDAVVYHPSAGVVKITTADNLHAYSPYTSIDVDQKIVTEGLSDTHMHLLSTALEEYRLDLRGTRSIEEIKRAVKKRVVIQGPNSWVIGRGWDQDKLVEKRMPTRYDLDEVAPDTPVFLIRVCGHVAVANTKALEVLGVVSEKSILPYVDFEDEKPSGILYEKAVDYAVSRLPPPSVPEATEALRGVVRRYLSLGVTCLNSMSAPPLELESVKKLLQAGAPSICYHAYVDFERIDLASNPEYAPYIRGVKLYSDGSFGGWTAALRQPYQDKDTSGRLLLRADKIITMAQHARKKGLLTAVHAIGDRALEEVLKAASEAGNIRIEHASLTPPDLVEKIAESRPWITVQPHFILSDTWIVERLGERARHVYAYKTLLSTGARVTGSSDSPVEPLNPWLGVFAAIDRGESLKMPIYEFTRDQRLSFHEALGLYTRGFEGKPPSIVVLNTRDMPRHKEDFERIKAELVVIEGRTLSF